MFGRRTQLVSGYLDFELDRSTAARRTTASERHNLVHRWEAPQQGEKVRWFLSDPSFLYDVSTSRLVDWASVPPELVRQYDLRVGDYIEGEWREGSLVSLSKGPPEERPFWRSPTERDEEFPQSSFGINDSPALRLIDLLAPIGPGQRGAVIAPAGAGKTTLMRLMASFFRRKLLSDEIDALYLVLIGERPEDVEMFCRNLRRTPGVIISATHFDTPMLTQIRSAELALMAAQREGESDRNVVVLVDSLTRLGRAYNLYISTEGKTLPGGLDPGTLQALQGFMGGARAKGKGRVTVLGTLLLEISRTDEATMRFLDGIANWQFVLQSIDARPKDLPEELFPLPAVALCRTRELEEMFNGDAPWEIQGRRTLRGQLVELRNERGSLVPHTRRDAPERLNQLLSTHRSNTKALQVILEGTQREERNLFHQEVINLSGKLRGKPGAVNMVLNALLNGPLGWGKVGGVYHLINALTTSERDALFALLQKDGLILDPSKTTTQEKELVVKAGEESRTEAEELAAQGIPSEMLTV